MRLQEHEPVNFLRSAVEEKRLTRDFVESVSFHDALSFAGSIVQSGPEEEKAHVLSLLGLLAESSRPAARSVEQLLKHYGPSEAIFADNLKTAKEQEYFAKALGRLEARWADAVAVDLIVSSDPSATRVSAALIEVLFRNNATACEVTHAISEGLRRFRQENRDQESSVRRKSEQLLILVSEKVATNDVELGDATIFGEALLGLCSNGGLSKAPEKLDRAEKSAAALLNALRQLFRLRFREVITLSPLYRIPYLIKNWWAPSDPPHAIEKELRGILTEGLGALLLFARQGVHDRALRSTLIESFGAPRFGHVAKRLLQEDDLASRDMLHWVTTGRDAPKERTLGVAKALAEDDFDAIVAKIMIAGFEGSRAAADVEYAADIVEPFDLDAAQRLYRSKTRFDNLLAVVRQLARYRSMRLEPEAGTRLRYDASVHESDNPIDQGAPVIVSTPGVKRDRGTSTLMISKPVVKEL